MLNFLEKFKNLFNPNDKSRFITFWVKCDKCGEEIKVLINKRTDLINEYENSQDKPSYLLKKEVLGNNCQNLIKLIVGFDKNYNVVYNNVENGKLIKHISGIF